MAGLTNLELPMQLDPSRVLDSSSSNPVVLRLRLL